MARGVCAFFYGSFIIPSVRAQHGFADRPVSVARLDGYDVRVDPLTRIIRDDHFSVYGVVANTSGEELQTLYAAEWMDRYAPAEVAVELLTGARLSALTYLPDGPISQSTVPATYLEGIIETGIELGFPATYIERLRAAI